MYMYVCTNSCDDFFSDFLALVMQLINSISLFHVALHLLSLSFCFIGMADLSTCHYYYDLGHRLAVVLVRTLVNRKSTVGFLSGTKFCFKFS